MLLFIAHILQLIFPHLPFCNLFVKNSFLNCGELVRQYIEHIAVMAGLGLEGSQFDTRHYDVKMSEL